ncbi:hypothetical protein EJ591_22290 [Pseudomonas aeruginosa]|nr:hypothetical protein D7H65_31970 [Pseudomonas aeruginosa]AZN55011.1 hypothetical protein EJP70_28695 [Pseudomonas aeruginosa]RTA84688.1 hypothetical protein EJ647_33685 [Pseudomonas aeruginosa]RTA86791.1 hypothetical protein EJ591_22290 [Pseudomonas aeruginosa]RTC50144.1 hypothetical protein EJ800_17410 [Pseudomonas aeruginosa]
MPFSSRSGQNEQSCHQPPPRINCRSRQLTKREKSYAKPRHRWGRLREGAESYAKALASDILR